MFKKNITKEEAKDTGLAIVLILLLLGFFLDSNTYFYIAIPFHLINMIVPVVFKPAAVVWFGFSHLLGTVMSKIILALVFGLLVIPVGVVRRWMGKDSLKLNIWKKGTESVFKSRNHIFTPSDLEKPF